MTSNRPPTPPNVLVPVPLRVMEFANARKMRVVQVNAQRMFGPPVYILEGWNPPDGSEVFVARIPRKMQEPEIIPFLEKAGPIFQLRLLMDFSGTNRGYGFVQYFNPRQAEEAVRILNEGEILPGRPLVVVKSVDNRRLLLGGVPTNKSKQELLRELRDFSEGVVRVWKRWLDPPKTEKGALLVVYESHRAAAIARSKMLSCTFYLWECRISVDWAEPEAVPDMLNPIYQEPQVLRIKNLSRLTKRRALWDLFNEASYNGVKAMKQTGTKAFLCFYTRRHAETARAALNGTIVDGKEIQVDWNDPVNTPMFELKDLRRAGKSRTKRRRNRSSYSQSSSDQAPTTSESSATSWTTIDSQPESNAEGTIQESSNQLCLYEPCPWIPPTPSFVETFYPPAAMVREWQSAPNGLVFGGSPLAPVLIPQHYPSPYILCGDKETPFFSQEFDGIPSAVLINQMISPSNYIAPCNCELCVWNSQNSSESCESS